MNFLILKDFLRFFLNFSEFQIDFIIAQVMWQHVERPIAQSIMTVDRHLKWPGGGDTWHNPSCR